MSNQQNQNINQNPDQRAQTTVQQTHPQSPCFQYYPGANSQTQYTPGSYQPSQLPSGQCPNPQFHPGSIPPSQFPPGANTQMQYPPGSGLPSQVSPQSYPANQYQPGFVSSSPIPSGFQSSGSVSPSQYPQGSCPTQQYPPESIYPSQIPSGSQSSASVSPSQYPQGSYSPQQFPPGSISSSQFPQGSQYQTGSHPPASVLPSQYPQGSYTPQQYPPGSNFPSQFPQGSQYQTGSQFYASVSPSQYPPTSYPPQQYPPGSMPPSYPQTSNSMPQGTPYYAQSGQPQQPQAQGQLPQHYAIPAQGSSPSVHPQQLSQASHQKPCESKPGQKTTNTPGQPTAKVPRQKFVLVGLCVPSLKIPAQFSATNDAKALEKAFKGFGCDTKAVVSILTHRSSAQRELIKAEYKKLYGKCLIDRTKKELLDPLEHIMVTLLHMGPEQDAYLLRKATKGLGTFDDILIQVLCTRSSVQIATIKDTYQKMYGKNLIESIRGDTSGNFRKLLIHLIEKPRQQFVVDVETASKVATSIYEKSIMKTGAPESLIEKLCSCSYDQLIQINHCFISQFSKPIHKYLKSYMNGNYEQALITICYYIHNPINYFAKFLKKSLHSKMIFPVALVICTRCEIDLGTIALAYHTNYHKHLHEDIKSTFNQNFPQAVDALEMLLGHK